MGFIRWGGKKYYPQRPKPYKPDINELMKPLSEKVGKGNIWGSQIMNVEKDVTPAPPPPFSPADISDLVGWFDVSQSVTLTGTNVDSIEDLSSSMGDLLFERGTKATYYPSGFTANNLPYIRGANNTTSRYETLSNWSATTASTIYIICSFYTTIGGAYSRYMDTAGYSNGFIMLDTSSSPNDEISLGFSSSLSANLDPILDTPSVLRVRWDGTQNLIRLNNGTEINTGSVLASQPSSTLTLFNRKTSEGVLGAPFDVAEIIIYNRYLTNTELTQMDTYIQNKYGL